MEEAAARSQSLWAASGGNWMNAERAYYLRAQAANHVSNWEAAVNYAKESIKIIDTEGEEAVDRACLFLELARAYKGLSQPEREQEARKEAIATADTFAEKFPDEPELKEWFEGLLNKQ